MKEFIRLLVVGVVVVLVVAVPARSQFKSKASHVNNRIVSTNFDTLSTADQSYIDSLSWKVASMVIEVLNETGSNSGSQSRKNWGALHIHDGDDGTDHGCGQSIYMIGDGTFGSHYKSGGEHSSAIKATAIGNSPNHRLFNILMSAENVDYNNHYGILIRNPSDEGIPLDILNGSNEPAIYITDTNVSDDKDAKAMIEILADSAAEATSDFVNLGLKIAGTSLEGTGDRYITMVDYNSADAWGITIDPTTDELLFYFSSTKIAGIGTDGVYTDYVAP